MELSIAKEKYNSTSQIKGKLNYEKWVEFIEKNLDYFIWYDDTEQAKYLKENIDKVPAWAREGIMNSSKIKAYAEFNTRKGWHEIEYFFHGDLGVIKTTFQKRITKEHLARLLDLANYLDALLLKDGEKLIDEKFIQEFSR